MRRTPHAFRPMPAPRAVRRSENEFVRFLLESLEVCLVLLVNGRATDEAHRRTVRLKSYERKRKRYI